MRELVRPMHQIRLTAHEHAILYEQNERKTFSVVAFAGMLKNAAVKLPVLEWMAPRAEPDKGHEDMVWHMYFKQSLLKEGIRVESRDHPKML